MIRAALNLFCVSLSVVCKLPQLRFHLSSRSSEGLSKSSLALETLSLSCTFCYFSANIYPTADYFEYPLLIAQNLALFALAAYFESTSALVVSGAAVAYFIPVYLLSQNILAVQMISPLSIPMSSLSKIMQIKEIYSTGRGDLVSRSPWIIFAVTSAARFYTVFSETADNMLLFQYTVSIFLNILVVITAVVYSDGDRRIDQEIAKKMI